MDDPVAVALKGVAGAADPAVILVMAAAPAGGGVRRPACGAAHLAGNFSMSCPGSLVKA